MHTAAMRIPWYLGAPGFLAAVVIAALASNYLGADYFKRTRLDEANPLAALVAPGGPIAAKEVASAEFRGADSGHRGSGTARILRADDGSLTLRLENFSVTNGPDLFVVLSTGNSYVAEGAIILGGLKATDGNFNYPIPDGTDISPVRSAVIWCRQFNVAFAVATFGRSDSTVEAATPTIAAVAALTATASASVPTATNQAAAVQTATPASAPPPTSTPLPTKSSVVGPQLVSKGKFRDGEPGHRGSGTATLGRDASGKPVLVFEGFSVTNGPDLHVILGTKSSGGGQGLDLGKLKATDGTFSYALPDGADLALFRSVTIWCASFPTIFAVAELEA